MAFQFSRIFQFFPSFWDLNLEIAADTIVVSAVSWLRYVNELFQRHSLVSVSLIHSSQLQKQKVIWIFSKDFFAQNQTYNFSGWIRSSGQSKSVLEFDESKNVPTRVHSGPVFVVSIQNPVVSLRCTGEVQLQLSGIGRILGVCVATDFFVFVAEDSDITDVNGRVITSTISGTNTMGISGLEKAGNSLDLVPISKILQSNRLFSIVFLFFIEFLFLDLRIRYQMTIWWRQLGKLPWFHQRSISKLTWLRLQRLKWLIRKWKLSSWGFLRNWGGTSTLQAFITVVSLCNFYRLIQFSIKIIIDN